MKYLIDLHTHTNYSSHAYSSLEENIKAASDKGLKVVANSMHGPALLDSPHWWGIANQKTLPKYINGIRVLKGVEANIIDENGNLDINSEIIRVCEIILGGLHSIPEYGDKSDIIKNTNAIINVMENNVVDVIVHLGNPEFPVDYEKIVKKAKDKNVALEFNNGSLTTSRKGSRVNCELMMKYCKIYKPFISLGSDAHFSGLVGELTEVEKLIEGYDENLIINSNIEKLEEFLTLRGKKL